MMRLLVSFVIAIALTLPTHAQSKSREERLVERNRIAMEVMTSCIVINDAVLARSVLDLDHNSQEFRDLMRKFPDLDVVERCFDAVPGQNRLIGMNALALEGGLAEHLIETDGDSLKIRLNGAVVGPQPVNLIREEAFALCIVTGAPHLVADLFVTDINTSEEVASIATIMPIAEACLTDDQSLDASALGLRSILAIAAYRLLGAQERADA